MISKVGDLFPLNVVFFFFEGFGENKVENGGLNQIKWGKIWRHYLKI